MGVGGGGDARGEVSKGGYGGTVGGGGGCKGRWRDVGVGGGGVQRRVESWG